MTMKLKFYERIEPVNVALALAAVFFASAILYAIKSAEAQCPKIEYMQDAYSFSENNRTFFLQKGYVLDVGHSYDVVETEEGYDMVFHFTKEDD